MFVVKRSTHNPIINPVTSHPWEAKATYNWSPMKLVNGQNSEKGKTHVFYRALGNSIVVGSSRLMLSTIGHAVSEDGRHFKDHEQFVVPEKDWERYGCEDPRVSVFEGKYYIFYTALAYYPFSPSGIRVGVAVVPEIKDTMRGVSIEKHLVTPFNAKAMVLFPRRIKGKLVALFSAHTDSPPAKMAIAQMDNVEDLWSDAFWEKWQSEMDKHIINPRREQNDQIEVGAVPIELPEGWLLIYSHIQNYGTPEVSFGVEALLLDLDDPTKIIGHTHGPIMIAEETYERYGMVSNLIFPSGTLLNDDELEIYYGAADTTCCMATVNVRDLVDHMLYRSGHAFVKYFTRYDGNPIIEPISNHSWENKATFNPAAVDIEGRVYILYRAMGADNTSVIGLAVSKDGLTIDERLESPIYLPRAPFESKGEQGGNSGCEDPRVTVIGDRLYMCYTAYDGRRAPAVAATSISIKDFLDRKWTWAEPEIITVEDIDDKDACLLQDTIDGQYLVYHRIDGVVYADKLSSLNFKGQRVNNRIQVLAPRHGMWDSRKVGIASPPIRTEQGYLMLYHGISEHGTYRVGACLLDLNDPTSVISRTSAPIFEPTEKYEKEGQVGSVVFPCGTVVREAILYMYYGGGDSVVGVATIPMGNLLASLTR